MVIPLTVARTKQKEFMRNYERVTKGKDRLLLFAGDQKIEHLNKDFYGEGIPQECGSPEHLFKIASKAPIGAFATQLGLVARYGADYGDINYVIKLNSRTDLVPDEPVSRALYSVLDIIEFKKHSGLDIVGVGYTVYLGSEHEAEMLTEAAQMIHEAHEHGLLTFLWMYPRGKAVKHERHPDVIAGAAGVGACLGADFVKVNPPEGDLRQAVMAAGRTKIICSGGVKKDSELFLQELRTQLAAGTAGCAVGRNVHQRTEAEAIAMCEKIAHVLFGE
jgi:DhnA-type fructose-1,6-bisphosphate aldolase and related enzymes